jgi:hypothetical protein
MCKNLAQINRLADGTKGKRLHFIQFQEVYNICAILGQGSKQWNKNVWKWRKPDNITTEARILIFLERMKKPKTIELKQLKAIHHFSTVLSESFAAVRLTKSICVHVRISAMPFQTVNRPRQNLQNRKWNHFKCLSILQKDKLELGRHLQDEFSLRTSSDNSSTLMQNKVEKISYSDHKDNWIYWLNWKEQIILFALQYTHTLQ